MKKQYIMPTVQLIVVELSSNMLAGSNEVGTTVYQEQAGENVKGLSRGQSSIWDDEE